MRWSDIEWDGVKRVLINPDTGFADGELAELKHRAALHNASVQVSRVVPAGKVFLLPRGLPELGCSAPHPPKETP